MDKIMAKPVIRILLVDDHYVVRTGLRAILEDEPDLSVAAEAEDGRQAVELFRVHRPDVVLMDLRMPGLDGVEATRRIREEFPQARVIMLTTYDGDQDIHRAVRAGACGYVLKDLTGSELIRAVKAVHVGKTYMPEAVASRLAESRSRPELTPRELEVLKMVVTGLSNKEIADALEMSEHTAKTHIKSILTKLGVRDRTEAATVALQRGFVR
jgi:two-component system NarL family response regulator